MKVYNLQLGDILEALVFKSIHSSKVYNSKVFKNKQRPIDRKMNELWYIHTAESWVTMKMSSGTFIFLNMDKSVHSVKGKKQGEVKTQHPTICRKLRGI